MHTFKIAILLGVSDAWLRDHTCHEENDVGNRVLELLQTPDFTPDWRIEVEQLD